MDNNSLTNLAAAVVDRPAQAINLLRPDLSAEPMVQVSNFAFMLKNRIRQSGLSELADAVHLTGTGMAFPWALFRDAPLATDSIVEDLKLGIDFARQGRAPILARDATVWSSASTLSGTLTQRTRWEGGFLATSASVVVPLLIEGARRLRGQLVILGLQPGRSAPHATCTDEPVHFFGLLSRNLVVGWECLAAARPFTDPDFRGPPPHPRLGKGGPCFSVIPSGNMAPSLPFVEGAGLHAHATTHSAILAQDGPRVRMAAADPSLE
jgi:hypothetical protein